MGDNNSPAADSLLVFADDWGRHPSSCQHLVKHLLPRHRVAWVNTIGTRTPCFDLATMRRGMEKMGQWLLPKDSSVRLPDNLTLCNPRMLPWFGSAMSRRLNHRLLRRQLTGVLRSLPEVPVAITTIPLVSDLIGVLPVRRWVYYCVDDFGKWPGLDQKTLQVMENRLIDKADVLIAVSETLQTKLARHGRSSYLLTHGVDLDIWTTNNGMSPCPELADLERPLVVFWGVVDRRMDKGFVERLGTDMQEGSIVLIGPTANPDPELARIPRVRQLGAAPFERLPHIAHQASVLIMPYSDLPVTRAIQPLKLKEYLATGKPTVVRDLPANRDWSDCLDLAATPEVFSQAVRQRLITGLPNEQEQARKRLASESWAEKARSFAEWALSSKELSSVAI